MILYPNKSFENITQIKINFLKENKINALILDIDNTLIDYYQVLAEEKIDWINEMKRHGIKLYILSNTNKKEKVEKVSRKLDVSYINFAKKPSRRGFKKVQKILNENPENIAVVGDQIFTDVLGGNRCKMFTILVEPVGPKDIWLTRLKRPFEKIVKNRYKKSLNKGELKC